MIEAVVGDRWKQFFRMSSCRTKLGGSAGHTVPLSGLKITGDAGQLDGNTLDLCLRIVDKHNAGSHSWADHSVQVEVIDDKAHGEKATLIRGQIAEQEAQKEQLQDELGQIAEKLKRLTEEYSTTIRTFSSEGPEGSSTRATKDLHIQPRLGPDTSKECKKDIDQELGRQNELLRQAKDHEKKVKDQYTSPERLSQGSADHKHSIDSSNVTGLVGIAASLLKIDMPDVDRTKYPVENFRQALYCAFGASEMQLAVFESPAALETYKQRIAASESDKQTIGILYRGSATTVQRLCAQKKATNLFDLPQNRQKIPRQGSGFIAWSVFS